MLIQLRFQEQLVVSHLVRNLQQGHAREFNLAHAVGIVLILVDNLLGRHVLQGIRREFQNLLGKAIIFHPILRADLLLVEQSIGDKSDDFENHSDEVVLFDHVVVGFSY